MNTITRRATIACCLVAATLAALAGCQSQPDSSDVLRQAGTGSCVRIGFDPRDEWESVACDADSPGKYKVISTHEGADTNATACKDQADVDTGKIVLIDPKRTVCLRWNPKVGECVAQGQGHYFECAAGGGHRIASIHPDTVDPQSCANGDSARVYAGDKLVLCLTANPAS
ncbi:MAG TPA: hypothetical protein VGD67_19810 [Pseudonocardiaceae bacterium]